LQCGLSAIAELLVNNSSNRPNNSDYDKNNNNTINININNTDGLSDVPYFIFIKF